MKKGSIFSIEQDKGNQEPKACAKAIMEQNGTWNWQNRQKENLWHSLKCNKKNDFMSPT